MSSLKIGIIGGSIAGCAAAIVLQRMGHQALIFEQSAADLQSRGAGICIDKALHQQLIIDDYVDVNMPHLELKSRPFYDGASGRLLWDQPISGVALNWGILYRNLRRRVIDRQYYRSAEVAQITPQTDQVNLVLVDGRQFNVDLVICADGFYSLGRRLLFSEQFVRSVGYIAWRGLIPAPQVKDSDKYRQQIRYFGYPLGHLLLYGIPDYSGQDEYLVNWLIYQRVTTEEMQRFLTDREGWFHQYHLPPGVMSVENQHYLQTLATQNFLPNLAELVKQTTMPFIQHIHEINLPYLRRDRILLLGDAGILVRPQVASGAIKALQGAFQLGIALQEEASIEAALARWDQQRVFVEQELFRLGQSFGQALVEQAPLWNQMNADSMQQWWDAAIKGRRWYGTALDI